MKDTQGWEGREHWDQTPGHKHREQRTQTESEWCLWVVMGPGTGLSELSSGADSTYHRGPGLCFPPCAQLALGVRGSCFQLSPGWKHGRVIRRGTFPELRLLPLKPTASVPLTCTLSILLATPVARPGVDSRPQWDPQALQDLLPSLGLAQGNGSTLCCPP